jgi:hypothetical protein
VAEDAYGIDDDNDAADTRGDGDVDADCSRDYVGENYCDDNESSYFVESRGFGMDSSINYESNPTDTGVVIPSNHSLSQHSDIGIITSIHSKSNSTVSSEAETEECVVAKSSQHEVRRSFNVKVSKLLNRNSSHSLNCDDDDMSAHGQTSVFGYDLYEERTLHAIDSESTMNDDNMSMNSNSVEAHLRRYYESFRIDDHNNNTVSSMDDFLEEEEEEGSSAEENDKEGDLNI